MFESGVLYRTASVWTPCKLSLEKKGTGAPSNLQRSLDAKADELCQGHLMSSQLLPKQSDGLPDRLSSLQFREQIVLGLGTLGDSGAHGSGLFFASNKRRDVIGRAIGGVS
jgi:hypothetical protein